MIRVFSPGSTTDGDFYELDSSFLYGSPAVVPGGYAFSVTVIYDNSITGNPVAYENRSASWSAGYFVVY